MSKTYKVMVIAGEASGDILAAGAMAELKNLVDGSLEFIGVGGEEMQKQGLTSAFPMEELSIMGIAEVLPHIPLMLRRMKEMKELAEREQPDLLLTVDAPDFCLRVAKKVKKVTGIPCVHYVSPSIWAWRRKRVFKMEKFLDHVMALFPFESAFYQATQLPCTFVGHPVVERLSSYTGAEKGTELLLMPGSRKREISSLLPLFYEEAMRLQAEGRVSGVVCALAREADYTFTASLVPSLKREQCVIGDARYSKMAQARLTFAASGTANLELAVLGAPMVVAYRAGKLTAFIARKIIKVPYISPVNWVLGSKQIPELLQEELTLENLHGSAVKELESGAQGALLQQVKKSLTTPNPNVEAAKVLQGHLK